MKRSAARAQEESSSRGVPGLARPTTARRACGQGFRVQARDPLRAVTPKRTSHMTCTLMEVATAMRTHCSMQRSRRRRLRRQGCTEVGFLPGPPPTRRRALRRRHDRLAGRHSVVRSHRILLLCRCRRGAREDLGSQPRPPGPPDRQTMSRTIMYARSGRHPKDLRHLLLH